MAIRLVILGVIAYYLYSNRTTLLNLYNNLNALRSPVTGYWKVKAGDLIFEVDLLTDSSFNETLFGKGGKWRLASGTTSDHFGELIFYNEENAFNTFSILNLSDSILMLQGKNDQHQVILSKMKTSERMPVDSVTRFLACFDPALPIPPSSSSIKETIDAIIPEKAGLLPVEMLIKNDTLAVATLSDPKDGWNTYVVVINPLLKLRLELNALPHGNACDATHKINFLKGRPVVVQNTVCTEASNAEKTTQCFTLEETGKLSETSCEGIAGASRLNQ